MRSAIVVTALACGCWHDPQPPSQAAPAAPQPPAHPSSQHSDWEGQYTCSQGPTAVRLGLDVARSGAVTATFEFGALASNPGVPHGLYKMRGKLRMLGGGAFELELGPDAWIEQPPGYVMIGFTATSDRDRRTLGGRIDNPRCGAITVSRVR